MSMLAEPRRKVKYGMNPRGDAWSKDENKIGQKMLEKMGWSKGKGLGAKEDGNPDIIKVGAKNDKKGMGCTTNNDKFVPIQADLNALFASLNEGNNSDASKEDSQAPQEKAKPFKSRVYHKKSVKVKDFSKMQADQLKGVFGPSESAPSTPTIQSQNNSAANSGDESSSSSSANAAAAASLGEKNDHGVTTISTGVSVQDYFANKMALLKAKRGSAFTSTPASMSNNSSYLPQMGLGMGLGLGMSFTAGSMDDSQQEIVAGFGYSSKQSTETMEKNLGVPVSVGLGCDANNKRTEEDEKEPPVKKKKSKKSKKEIVEPVSEDSEELVVKEKTKKSKRKKKDLEEEAVNEEVAKSETEEGGKEKKKKSKRKRKDLEEEEDEVITQARKKKKASQETPDEEEEKKVSRKQKKSEKRESEKSQEGEVKKDKKKCKKSKEEKSEEESDIESKKSKKKSKKAKKEKDVSEDEPSDKKESLKRKMDSTAAPKIKCKKVLSKAEIEAYSEVFKGSNCHKLIGYRQESTLSS